MVKQLIYFLALCGVMPLVSQDYSTQDLLILTRLFQGEQQAQGEGKGSAWSQFIDPYSQSFEAYLAQSKQEAEKIKNVYNLAAVTPLNVAKWHWEGKKPGKLANTLSLKQTTLSIQMEQLGANRFKVTVMEGADLKASRKELLSSEFVLPPSHTTIFGFRDGEAKIFFLSFHHMGTTPAMNEKNFKPTPDKIIAKTMPPYPKAALEKKIEGTVIIKGHFDDAGAVIPQSIEIVSGHPMFNETATKVLTELRYDPRFTPVPLNKIILLAMFRIVGNEEADTFAKAERDKVKESEKYREQMILLKEDEQKGLVWLTLSMLVIPNRK